MPGGKRRATVSASFGFSQQPENHFFKNKGPTLWDDLEHKIEEEYDERADDWSCKLERKSGKHTRRQEDEEEQDVTHRGHRYRVRNSSRQEYPDDMDDTHDYNGNSVRRITRTSAREEVKHLPIPQTRIYNNRDGENGLNGIATMGFKAPPKPTINEFGEHIRYGYFICAKKGCGNRWERSHVPCAHIGQTKGIDEYKPLYETHCDKCRTMSLASATYSAESIS